ncbi:MAG: DUF2158 domain-containing protein [Sulfurovum sp.]|nr:DUF2158 domain-containing protein [Sulfurovum sp.]
MSDSDEWYAAAARATGIEDLAEAGDAYIASFGEDSRIDYDRLEEGCTVRLNSGGPHMTIKQINTYSEIICIWFDKNNKLQTSEFIKHEISLVNGYCENENDSDLEKGDTIRLNSGGPLMTISDEVDTGYVDDYILTSKWFDKNNILHSAEFVDKTIKFDSNDGNEFHEQVLYNDENNILKTDTSEDEIPF